MKKDLDLLDAALTDAVNSGDPADPRKVWLALIRLRDVLRALRAKFKI